MTLTPEAHSLLMAGAHAAGGGDFSTALDRFRRAVDAAPAAWQPHVEMGNVFRAARQPDQALAHYRQALNRHGPAYDLLMTIGAVHLEHGNADDAVTAMTSAAALAPNDPRATADDSRDRKAQCI